MAKGNKNVSKKSVKKVNKKAERLAATLLAQGRTETAESFLVFVSALYSA